MDTVETYDGTGTLGRFLSRVFGCGAILCLVTLMPVLFIGEFLMDSHEALYVAAILLGLAASCIGMMIATGSGRFSGLVFVAAGLPICALGLACRFGTEGVRAMIMDTVAPVLMAIGETVSGAFLMAVPYLSLRRKKKRYSYPVEARVSARRPIGQKGGDGSGRGMVQLTWEYRYAGRDYTVAYDGGRRDEARDAGDTDTLWIDPARPGSPWDRAIAVTSWAACAAFFGFAMFGAGILCGWMLVSGGL